MTHNFLELYANYIYHFFSLNLSQTSPYFTCLQKKLFETLWEKLWEKEKLLITSNLSFSPRPPGGLSGERVGLMTMCFCQFDPRLRRLFFLAYFRLSPLQKHVRKVVGGFGKKSCVTTGVRKPGNTYASPTAMP